MGLRHNVWRALPGFLKPAALIGYGAFQARQYYGPYLFGNGRSKPPRGITFEITYRCNLRCVMCPLAPSFDEKDSQIVYEWKNEQELTADEVTGLIDDAAAMGVKGLSLTGGEPFIRKDLIEIIRYVKGKGMECAVTTNGTLLSEEDAGRVVNAGLDIIQCSLDGPEEIHNEIRQSNRAYQKTVDAARWVDRAKREAGVRLPSVTLGYTISAANMDHLVSMVDIAHDVNANLRFGYLYYTTEEMIQQTDAILPVGRVKGEDQDVPEELKAVEPDRLYQQVCEAKQRASELGVPIRFLPDLNRDEIRRRFQDDNYSYVNKCFHPWISLRVNPYGVVYPCSMNIEMGNVRRERLAEIWNGPKYVEFRRELKKRRLFPKCAKCCVLTNKVWDYLPAI